MAKVQNTVLTLRFFGDDLDPHELTDALGAAPTRAFVKGSTMSSASGSERVAKSGQWLLTLEAHAPDDLEMLIAQLFRQLTSDLGAWLSLAERFEGELFVGLFMGSRNEGLSLGLDTLTAITARNLKVQFDIYDPSND